MFSDPSVIGSGNGDDAGTGLFVVDEEHGGAVGLYIGGHMDGGVDMDFFGAQISTATGAIQDENEYHLDFGPDDYCSDITVTHGSGTTPPTYVWLTGRSVGTSESASTVAFQQDDGAVLGSTSYQHFSGGDARSNAMISFENTSCVWITGVVRSGLTDYDTFTINYDLNGDDPTSLNLLWMLRADAGNETAYDEATCICQDGGGDVFCGGVTGAAGGYGLDFLTMRILP